ncbi:unnamed protein product [Citrullus colocynthis]|uniref:Secreted protein n=1 Tax=Citrullus colocynthis TaxID=252529 RepID=A0ABP0Y2I9_9ROSI
MNATSLCLHACLAIMLGSSQPTVLRVPWCCPFARLCAYVGRTGLWCRQCAFTAHGVFGVCPHLSGYSPCLRCWPPDSLPGAISLPLVTPLVTLEPSRVFTSRHKGSVGFGRLANGFPSAFHSDLGHVSSSGDHG